MQVQSGLISLTASVFMKVMTTLTEGTNRTNLTPAGCFLVVGVVLKDEKNVLVMLHDRVQSG